MPLLLPHSFFLTTHCCIVHCSLSLASSQCSLCTILCNCSLFTIHCSLLTTYCSLLTTHCSLGSLLIIHSLQLLTADFIYCRWSQLTIHSLPLHTAHYSFIATAHSSQLPTFCSLFISLLLTARRLNAYCSMLTAHYSLLFASLSSAHSIITAHCSQHFFIPLYTRICLAS
jgi:hypothetical protein